MKTLICLATRRAAIPSLVVALVFLAACGGGEDTAARDACEEQVGVGNCFRRQGKWYPRGAIIGGATTTSTTTTSTTTTTTTVATTTTPPTTAAPPTSPPPPPPPADAPERVVLEERRSDRPSEDRSTGTFAVEGNWFIEFRFGSGSVRSYPPPPSCSFRGTVKTPSGSNPGLPEISGAGSAGHGKQDYAVSGTFVVEVHLDCPSEAYSGGEPGWYIKVVD